MWGTVWQLQIAVWHYNHTKSWWWRDKLLLPASPHLWKMTGLTWVRRMGLKFLGSLVMAFSSWGHFIAFHCSSRSEKGSFPTSLPMCINDGHSDGLGSFRRDEVVPGRVLVYQGTGVQVRRRVCPSCWKRAGGRGLDTGKWASTWPMRAGRMGCVFLLPVFKLILLGSMNIVCMTLIPLSLLKKKKTVQNIIYMYH